VIVTPEGITYENQRILDFSQDANQVGASDISYAFRKNDLDEGGRRIIPLFDALTKAREKAEVLRAKSKARDEQGQPLPFHGILAIQADKKIRFETIRRIMYTAASAGFKTFRFLATRKEG
jgi:hypothetical protein